MSMLALGLLFGAVTLTVMFSGMPIAFALGAVAVGFMYFFMPASSLDIRGGEIFRTDGKAGPSIEIGAIARALAAYGVGLIGLILIKILAPGFYAKQDIKTPVKIGVGVLVATQLGNYVFVPIFAHAGLTLSVGLGACVNALFLFLGLRKRGIYTPSSGWAPFFGQLVGASLVLAGVMHWFAKNFDWIGMHARPVERIVLLAACLVLFAALYFGMLWLMGFKYAYFRRRVQ